MFTVKAVKWILLFALTVSSVCVWSALSVSAAQEELPSPEQVRTPGEIIDPHFTGRNCEVCHEAAPSRGDTDLHLKFGGDDVEMCNSCHQTEYVKGDLHPTGIVPPEGNSIAVPSELPLYGGKVTCRTCHHVYLQCQNKPSIQFENVNFLRGAPYKKIVDLCYRCHDRETYKKTNPHEQIDAEGTIIKKQCLYCHESLPDPNSVSGINDVTFKIEPSTFCNACHASRNVHLSSVDHFYLLSEEMHATVKASEEKFEVALPLFKGKIFCGTCHNPHDKGVITRAEAAKGSQEEKKLRLDASYDLCVACHSEQEDLADREVSITIRDEDLIPYTREREDIPSYHKSFLEKKCRACHSITRESPEPPVVYKMCFQVDCHDASLVEETFKHRDALEGNCLLCHSQHGSHYGAHIVNDQEKLCKACHPLITPVEEDEMKDEKGKGGELHDFYLALFRKLVPDQEVSCSYCHGEDHSESIYEQGIISCYQCHRYIKDLITGEGGKPRNIHETFVRFTSNNCTRCHNPHSSPYPYLLKDEPESYKKR